MQLDCSTCFQASAYSGTMLKPRDVLLQKHARTVQPALDWRDNLDWTPDDILQLTLGDGHVQWELKGSNMDASVINEIKPVWKVTHYAES